MNNYIKTIQIATGGYDNRVLYALRDDGTIYSTDADQGNGWRKIKSID